MRHVPPLPADIKPANILLDESGNVKLGDLNVSRIISEGDLRMVRKIFFLSVSVCLSLLLPLSLYLQVNIFPSFSLCPVSLTLCLPLCTCLSLFCFSLSVSVCVSLSPALGTSLAPLLSSSLCASVCLSVCLSLSLPPSPRVQPPCHIQPMCLRRAADCDRDALLYGGGAVAEPAVQLRGRYVEPGVRPWVILATISCRLAAIFAKAWP
jgi:hypothetical protein